MIVAENCGFDNPTFETVHSQLA